MAEETVEPIKRPWQSRTLLVNGVLGLVAFAALFVPQAAGIGEWINGNGIHIVAVWSVLNTILRFVTKDKIQLFE